MKRKVIFHLIPQRGIGGVEQAAESCKEVENNKFYFCCKYLSKQNNNAGKIIGIYSLVEIVFSSIKISFLNPDILLVSLYKSYLSGLIIKFLKPKTKLIIFLHSSESFSFIDFCLTYLASKLAFQIWGDSNTTLENRYNELSFNKKIPKKTISFLLYKLEFNASKTYDPNFIFWGRFHKIKNIENAIKLFHKISLTIPNTNFTLIGPDFGELKMLKKLSNDLKLDDKLSFYPSMDIDQIKEYSKKATFFVQLSLSEGSGMSIMEAMQFGLIPIITNVGEAKKYCIHNQNSIIFSNIETTSNEVINLIENKKQMRYLRNNALNKWSKDPTYKEDIFKNLKSLF